MPQAPCSLHLALAAVLPSSSPLPIMAFAKAAELFKNVKDTIQNKTETEKLLDEALSKSSDFPSSTLRQKVAKLTFD